jgi:multiple sugar transport system ATP-binding protein
MHGEGKLIGAFRERIAERPGQSLRVSPDLDLVHLFDEATGARLN